MPFHTESKTITISTNQWVTNPFLGNCIQFLTDQECKIIFRWNDAAGTWEYQKIDQGIRFDTSEKVLGSRTALLDESMEIFVECCDKEVTGTLSTQYWNHFDLE